jgi:hypothetical protein
VTDEERVDALLDRVELALDFLLQVGESASDALALIVLLAATSARRAATRRRKCARRSGPKIRFEMKESARAITRSSRTYCHLPWPFASAAVSP